MNDTHNNSYKHFGSSHNFDRPAKNASKGLHSTQKEVMSGHHNNIFSELNQVTGHSKFHKIGQYVSKVPTFKSKFTSETDDSSQSSSKYGGRVSSRTSGSDSNNPEFYHPQQKFLFQEKVSDEYSDSEIDEFDEFLCNPAKFAKSSTFDAKNDVKKNGMNLTTYQSTKNIPFKNSSSNNQKARTLSEATLNSDNESEFSFNSAEKDYQNIWHFEEDLTDQEFMDVIVGRLRKVEGDITYKMFKKELLPSHRKPNFMDFARYRKLEKIMLSD